MRLELVEIHGSEEIKHKIPLDHFPIQMGREALDSTGYLPLPDCGGAYLSKLHCTIFKKGSALFLADGDPQGKPSKNGVWLDGKRLKLPALLHPGQIFILLKPPPCEIQVRVLAGEEIEEGDTLTPAAENLLTHPDSSEAIEQLSLAVAQLRGHWQENKNLDLQLRGDVARLQAERGALRQDLEQAAIEGERIVATMDRRLRKQEAGQKWLVRLVSGVCLAIALTTGAMLANDEKYRGQVVEISLQIILGIVGTGGLAMSARSIGASEDGSYQNSGDARAEKIAP